jgi:hypothetical protein
MGTGMAWAQAWAPVWHGPTARGWLQVAGSGSKVLIDVPFKAYAAPFST